MTRKDEAPAAPSSHTRLSRVADVCALLTVAIGLLVIAGWLLEIDPLKRVLPNLVAMKFNTALGFVLAGAGLWWRKRPVARIALGAVVAVLGALTLGEQIAGVNFGIDQFLIRDLAASPEAAYLPGRMAPFTALCFLLLGLALMGTGGGLGRPGLGPAGSVGIAKNFGFAAEMLALVAILIGGFSLIAYPTGVAYLRQLPGSISMALHTAAAFVVLALGILSAADGMVAQTLRLQGTGRALWIGFGVLTFLLVTVGVVYAVNTQTLGQDLDDQANVARPRREATLELENGVLGHVLAVRIARAGDTQGRRQASDAANEVDRQLVEYRALSLTDRQRDLAARFAAQWRNLRTLTTELLNGEGPLEPEESARLVALRMGLMKLLRDEMRSDAVAAFEAHKATTLRDLHQTGEIPLLLLVVSVLLALVTSGAVARAVSKQEQRVREQREWLRVTLSSIGDAVIACDTERRVSFLNPIAELLTGWKAEEAHGQPMTTVFRIINEQTRAPAADIAAQVLRERCVVALANHTAIVTRDGREIPIEDSAAPISDSSGEVTGAVLVFHDVTQRRRADKALRLSEEKFVKAFHGNSSAMAITRLRDGMFTDVNDRYLEVTRWARGDIVGKSSVQLNIWKHPEQRDRFVGALQQQGAVWNEEFSFTRQGGEEWTGLVFAQVSEVGGEQVIISSVVDITERKRAEEALAAANRQLAEADRHKNEFLAVLSHELRNPLTPVRNSLYVLKRAMPGSEQAKRAQEVIDRQTGQLARLVDDLLEVTRITRNKIQLQRAPLELNDLVRRSVEDYRSLFDERGVVLETKFAPEPLPINGDGARLAQVAGNLLQNAAKFTPTGGRVVVSTSAETARGRASLRVTDSGVGIDPAMLRRLFQPFMQADATLDRSRGGLGLGLALVKGLVEMHGGVARAHSEGCGTGAEFVIELPIDRTSAAEVTPGEARSTASHRRVLIIEDNIDAADSLREVLQFGGHEVEVAYNGSSGLATARGFRPDVVLCDIGLPGMDGYAVARAFRADEELRGAHLVALSGYALPEDCNWPRRPDFNATLPSRPASRSSRGCSQNLPLP